MSEAIIYALAVLLLPIVLLILLVVSVVLSSRGGKGYLFRLSGIGVSIEFSSGASHIKKVANEQN